MNWKIKYDNDPCANDDSFWEWWAVSDGIREFKCGSENDAKWLCALLEIRTAFTAELSDGPTVCTSERKKQS